jgi:serine/threonine-protein phosphatase 6 regulatory ankyrin repeat subunit B
MKTRTFLLLLILVLAVMIITGNSVTGSDTEVFLKSVKSGDYAEVKRLIEKGADVNARNNGGSTALMRASYRGRQDIVQLLIEAGADVNVQDNEGWTALMFASGMGHTEVAQVLIEAGAK